METLSKLVTKEIGNFFKGNPRQIFHNELDFQLQLANHLSCSGHFTNVFMEYYVPKGYVSNYPWNSQIYIDIVVERKVEGENSEFFLIELKYKTEAINRVNYTCFNEELTEITLLKNQGAQNHACYDFWRDVKRIEYVQARFSSVVGGVAIFLTNSEFYRDGKIPQKQKEDYAEFSLNPGFNSTAEKCWKNDKNKGERAPKITLQTNYNRQWYEASMKAGCNSNNDVKLYYCMVEV